MKVKKIATFLTMAALLVIPCNMASAASVSFSNFAYTTTPNAEAWKKIVSKTKADSEQNWYATLTASSGLSPSVARAMFVSGRATANAVEPDSAPIPLYSTTTSGKQSYFIYVRAGSTCWLNIMGDENSKTTYKVKVSGRYTS